ncbi:MAG: peptide-methionine (S)-S-oxide reductase MsrA [Gammaproteobacteria bacterium]|nr:peptide-methionine (S)-S-oxide reductase MsrA [Gammaproteobacteria bacterium]
MAIETLTLGGGCFWCLEAVFQELRGVDSVVSGYAGGDMQNPSYDQICTGSTGHAEVVQLVFNNDAVSVRTLLQVFFTIHDPTTLDSQGADVGSQYRSVIFYHTDRQKKEAETIIREYQADKIWNDPIVTQVLPVPRFYPAEEYHQDYYRQNSVQGYCWAVISPKLAKLRQQHRSLLKA